MRVHDRLDWWELEQWRASDAFIAIPSHEEDAIAAALLVVPIEFANINALASACSPAAWLRWCAVADRQSPSAMLHALLAEVEARLHHTAIRELWCVCEPHNWLEINLRDLGFKRRNELMTMSMTVSKTSRKPIFAALVETPKHINLRSLHPACIDTQTIHTLHEIDAAAFEPPWRYSAHMLQRSFLQSSYVTIAEQHEHQHDHIVGYQCAMRHDDSHGGQAAHITRLVVHPSAQHQGVGTALFADAVRVLQSMNVSEMTLNTPTSNVAAQRLYRRFGFGPLPERVNVLSKPLKPQT
jgi:ribosomal protein S18 acetylase RimI-like enzyme